MKKCKKLLSLLLCVLMLLSILPVNAIADEDLTQEEAQAEELVGEDPEEALPGETDVPENDLPADEPGPAEGPEDGALPSEEGDGADGNEEADEPADPPADGEEPAEPAAPSEEPENPSEEPENPSEEPADQPEEEADSIDMSLPLDGEKRVVDETPPGIEISETNFPNAAFRNFVKEYDNDPEDGYLSPEEIAAVTYMYIDGSEVPGITSFQGIGFFTALEKLICLNTNITQLDVSGNAALKELSCGYNPYLSSLTFNDSKALTHLFCSYSAFTSLDVRGFTHLTELNCAAMEAASLVVTNDGSSGSGLTELKLGGCTALDYLNCSENALTSLDLTGLTALTGLYCDYNALTSLDLSDCGGLMNLSCCHNNLTTLDVSACPYLMEAYTLGTPESFVEHEIYYSYEDSYMVVDDSVQIIAPCLPAQHKLALDQNYLLLEKGTSVTLNCTVEPAELSAYLTWRAEDEYGAEEDIAVTVDAAGKVTAEKVGTAWVVVELKQGESVYEQTRCRVDVMDGTMPTVATLPVTKVTVELYKTYPRVDVVLHLPQNIAANSVTLADDIVLADNGVTIKKAEFVGNSDSSKDPRPYFGLRAADDRTLEIVPLIDLDDSNKVAKAKSTFSSEILLTLSDGSTVTTPKLTIVGKDTLPKLSAQNVVLYSLIDHYTAPVVITGGKIKSVQSCNADKPGIAELDTDRMTATAVNGAKGKVKYTLSCELEGWLKPVTVRVTVQVYNQKPKMKFLPNTVPLSQAAEDSAAVAYQITPLAGAEHEITGYNVYEGNNLVNDVLVVDLSSQAGVMVVSLKNPDGQAHSYKVYPLVDGHEIAYFTVNVQAADAAPTLVLRANGVVNTAKAGSAVAVSLNGKNCSALTFTNIKLTIQQLDKKKTVVCADAEEDGLFQVEYPGSYSNVFTITGTDKLEYNKAYTYQAIVTADDGNGGVLTSKAVKINVIDSKKDKTLLTLTSADSIDVSMPGTAFKLIPKSPSKYYVLDFSEAVLHLDETLFDYTFENGAFIVTRKPGANIDPKATYKAYVTVGAFSSKEVKIKLKSARASIHQSTKAVTLSKNDRYDRQSVILTVQKADMADIARVEMYDPSGFLKLYDMGNGRYDIGYKDNKLPDNAKKPVTVKLYVYLAGNGGTKENGKLTVKVTIG